MWNRSGSSFFATGHPRIFAGTMAGIAALAILFVVGGFDRPKTNGPFAATQATLRLDPAPATGLAAARVFVECPGQIEARQREILRIKVGEIVGEILVKEGDSVPRNQPLVRLENPTLDAKILSLMGELEALAREEDQGSQLDVQIGTCRQSLAECDKRAADERAIAAQIREYRPEAMLDQIANDRRKLQGEMDLLQAQKSALTRSIGRSRPMREAYEHEIARCKELCQGLLIKAPFPARVIRINRLTSRLDVGEWIMEVWDESALFVNADVPQNLLPRFHVGTPVKVLPNFFENIATAGEIESIGYPDEAPKQSYPRFPVRIRLVAPPADLREGMAVMVRLDEAADRGAR